MTSRRMGCETYPRKRRLDGFRCALAILRAISRHATPANPLKRIGLVRGDAAIATAVCTWNFLGALMSQSIQKKMRMPDYWDHDAPVTAQIYR